MYIDACDTASASVDSHLFNEDPSRCGSIELIARFEVHFHCCVLCPEETVELLLGKFEEFASERGQDEITSKMFTNPTFGSVLQCMSSHMSMGDGEQIDI